MCDVCSDFLNLLESYESRLTSNEAKHTILLKSEIEVVFIYIQAWSQRQCMCMYRDNKTFDRFNVLVQSMIFLAVHHLKHIDRLIHEYKCQNFNTDRTKTKSTSPTPDHRIVKDLGSATSSNSKDKHGKTKKDDSDSDSDSRIQYSLNYSLSIQNTEFTDELWSLMEVEKLFVLVGKVYLLNFPLYIAYKNGAHVRLDDLTAEEAQHLAIFCDLHDNEVPVYLLRNVSMFCQSGGFAAMMLCFENSDLPVSTAHALTATVSNVKLWLNYGCIVQLFIPLRSRVLQYMCKLSDQNLRSAATRAMADFAWSTLRDPLEASATFDVEGLGLAFKYLVSTTLTMRLAGMAQINAHINVFNDICTTEAVGEVDLVGRKIANWLTENQLIQHLFGPNLHVEVIKQAQIVLNFLAVENQITEEYIKLIWQATQLKHCSKTIFELMSSLVKNLAPRPAMYLYSLLCRMDPKDHTEQSIYIASALTKVIWSRDNSHSQMTLMQDHILTANTTASSSDSGSMDGSNSDDDQGNGDDSSIGSGRKSPIDIENVGSDNGVTPCKQARRRIHVCDPTQEKSKLSEDEVDILKSKVDMKLKNHRIVNLIDNSSSDDEIDHGSIDLHLHRKSRKRRKNNNMQLARLSPETVEAMYSMGDEEASSDDGDDADAEILNDSDDCSDGGQVPTAVLKHLQGEGPYIRAIAETNISELLSGAENDGSFSSPMSNKSEKNLADFDEEDVSPCEEELAHLVGSNQIAHNCVPQAYAAAAVAMAAAHTALALKKQDSKAVASEDVHTNSAGNIVSQSAEPIRSTEDVIKALSISSKRSDSDVDITDNSKESPQSSSSSSTSQMPTFKLSEICQPGNTLLWDLLQDDKIVFLGEALAMETEKALASLLCFSLDRTLRTKFIEGCLKNLASNRSVIVCLRLLPKLFSSFQQFRTGDTHQITMWAERQHKMMQHFFNNIKFYTKQHSESLSKPNGTETQLYTHKTQVSVRLNFLSSIFSCGGSPKTFRLSLDQVDALWEWLAHDPDCADCYFSWLQSQAKGGDQHALGLDALQHIYLKKLPELRPEDFTMVGLGLFQQICSLARLAMSQYDKQNDIISTSNVVGIFHLWKIALRAHNTDVSMAAIQYINIYYMGQQLRLEKEFVGQCMDNLVQSTRALENEEDENALMCVQRGLMLLNTHLDTFRRRYAYHLRRWAIEGKGISSLNHLKNESNGQSIRIILQPAGLSEKSVLHMYANDLIADLKAEISKWWENLQCSSPSGASAPVLGLLLSEGPLRIITQGQELTSEYDERNLGEAGFKDNQIVYVSLGGRGARRKETNMDHPSLQPPPSKDSLPTLILLQPKYLEKLFWLMQSLGDVKPQNNTSHINTKAQLLSRRVWDILTLLPTNPTLLESFKRFADDLSALESDISDEERVNKQKILKLKLNHLLDPSNLQKFMYSLHIVESLAMNSVLQSRGGSPCCGGFNGNVITIEQHNRTVRKIVKKTAIKKRNRSESLTSSDKANEIKNSDVLKDSSDSSTHKESNSPQNGNDSDSDDSSNDNESQDKENNPIKHIKRYKKSDSSQSPEGKDRKCIHHDENFSSTSNMINTKWSDIFIKCGGLEHLYKIFISGQLQQSAHPKEQFNEWRHDCLAILIRIIWLLGFEDITSEEMHINTSRPHVYMMELIEVESYLRRLASILNDEAHHNHAAQAAPYPYQYHYIRTGFWGRAQVVQFAMNILVSYVQASGEARRLLWSKQEDNGWLLKFILEDPEPAVRREICAGLYRICLGSGHSFHVLLAPLLRQLLSFLPIAEKMAYGAQPQQFMLSDDGKEPYGQACRDYFWLVARLVDTMSQDMVKTELYTSFRDDAIDIDELCLSISNRILTRDFYETRHGAQDDGLVGLLNLMTNLIKFDPKFKYSSIALEFIDHTFDFLFDMPSPKDRYKPKCKSATSRAASYDLLVELCKGCPRNYTALHEKLLTQHIPCPKAQYPWDYWPRDEGRSECGYVGLTNLGATCYMASCIQHLYMMPQARSSILRAPPTGALKHGSTLMELQRMFAYLYESERKAYNPRSFCRVYQMDHQPLNTGEQKDMAEFFIDLVSKLEEMTPDLKNLVKRLFCGTLSNNVVSLDCGHVSRTAEEFYTVRCQVADMRNLQESLDEVTVKDTLEGDNMYTCSQCGKKVRAEKRACFKKLPQILCFNTMRYTFNMVTMLKEKVNTHFSFPMRLNMCDYVEKTLMPDQYKEDREKRKLENEKSSEDGAKSDTKKSEGDALDEDIEEFFDYELVGVTVHTGTADGGHYYSFIKERNKLVTQHERWFLFNDAEVKPFDPSQIAAECFGGEMTSKTYDSVTEKYLDFSYEKTNSAYMLFYERRLPEHLLKRQTDLLNVSTSSTSKNCKKKEKSAKSIDKCSINVATSIDECINLTDDDCEKSSTQVTKSPKKDNDKKISANTSSDVASKDGTSSDKDDAGPSASASGSVSVNDKSLMEDVIIEIYGDNDKSNSETEASDQILVLLNKELEDWIWQDNRQFLQDRNIFEHTYFNFMWQICAQIPQTLIVLADVACIAAKLSASFFIETFIHAKEKPTMMPWVELLTKQFIASHDACEWFLTHMSSEPWWPVQVLIQCPNQVVRQNLQRIITHVLQRQRLTQSQLYLMSDTDENGKEVFGHASSATRFISSLINLLDHGVRVHLRHLTEFFSLILDFSRMGDEETIFLLRIGLIKSVIDFYLGNKTADCIDIGSDNEDNSSDEAMASDKSRPPALDKMLALIANLVERSRGPDGRLRLSPRDYNALAGGKGFSFLYQQIKDNINIHQTKHLIHTICRWEERLAGQIICMLFNSVSKHPEGCGPFFKLLTLLTEQQGAPPGLPCFSQLVLQRVWEAAEYCPQPALEWLSFQAPKNKAAHAWILQSADNWVEQFLLAHNNTRVRNAASNLLVSLLPSQPIRIAHRSYSVNKPQFPNHLHRELTSEVQLILHSILSLLLRLLRPARIYADIGLHGTSKLTSYFGLLSFCMMTKTEKLMMVPYMRSLWDLFHPRLSEPSVPSHHNKHSLLVFWHHTMVDCPENALAVAKCEQITRSIAFNYILADHDDSDVVTYNRSMLPAYYGLLRLCCEQSRELTRHLAAHQNLQWAFKNITPHPTQYALAVEELFKLMSLFAKRHPDASDHEKHEVNTFRRTTLSSYLTSLDPRVSWSTLINAFRILVDNDEDRLLVIYNGGIEMCFEALHTLHSMHHEATACHVVGDMQELLGELLMLLSTLRISTRLDGLLNKKILPEPQCKPLSQQQSSTQQTHTALIKEKQIQQQLQQLQQQHFLRQHHHQTSMLKGLPDAVKRLTSLLNTFNPPEICRLALDALKELVRNPNIDITSILAPILISSHLAVFNSPNAIGTLGPYFPRRGIKSPWPSMQKSSSRPPRPMFQMSIPHHEMIQRGIDIEYDLQVDNFYRPYHDFIDILMRMAVNTNQMSESLVKLSCLVAIEATPLHFNLFPKFWVGIYNTKTTNKYAELLITNQYLVEYVHLVLREERVSLSDPYIRTFLEIYYAKIAPHLPIARLIYTISYSMHSKEDLDEICGDLFAIRVIAQCTGIPATVRKQLRGSLRALLYKSARYQELTESELFPHKKMKLDTDETAEEKGELEKTIVSETTKSVDTENQTKLKSTENNREAIITESTTAPTVSTTPKIDEQNNSVANKVNQNFKCQVEKQINAELDINKKTDDTDEIIKSPYKSPPMSPPSPPSISKSDIISISDINITPSTSKSAQLTSTSCSPVSKFSTSSESLLMSPVKKSVEERLYEEHEKRIKLLLTMETYIKSILTLMQKEECISVSSAGNAPMDITESNETNRVPPIEVNVREEDSLTKNKSISSNSLSSSISTITLTNNKSQILNNNNESVVDSGVGIADPITTDSISMSMTTNSVTESSPNSLPNIAAAVAAVAAAAAAASNLIANNTTTCNRMEIMSVNDDDEDDEDEEDDDDIIDGDIEEGDEPDLNALSKVAVAGVTSSSCSNVAVTSAAKTIENAMAAAAAAAAAAAIGCSSGNSSAGSSPQI